MTPIKCQDAFKNLLGHYLKLCLNCNSYEEMDKLKPENLNLISKFMLRAGFLRKLGYGHRDIEKVFEAKNTLAFKSHRRISPPAQLSGEENGQMMTDQVAAFYLERLPNEVREVLAGKTEDLKLEIINAWQHSLDTKIINEELLKHLSEKSDFYAFSELTTEELWDIVSHTLSEQLGRRLNSKNVRENFCKLLNLYSLIASQCHEFKEGKIMWPQCFHLLGLNIVKKVYLQKLGIPDEEIDQHLATKRDLIQRHENFFAKLNLQRHPSLQIHLSEEVGSLFSGSKMGLHSKAPTSTSNMTDGKLPSEIEEILSNKPPGFQEYIRMAYPKFERNAERNYNLLDAISRQAQELASKKDMTPLQFWSKIAEILRKEQQHFGASTNGHVLSKSIQNTSGTSASGQECLDVFENLLKHYVQVAFNSSTVEESYKIWPKFQKVIHENLSYQSLIERLGLKEDTKKRVVGAKKKFYSVYMGSPIFGSSSMPSPRIHSPSSLNGENLSYN